MTERWQPDAVSLDRQREEASRQESKQERKSKKASF
jgi:hypothetical protein